MIALGSVVAVISLSFRRSVAAEESNPSAAARALASLQVSVAPNGSLVVFDSSTGDVMRVTTGDKPAVEPVGTLRKGAAGKWELVPPSSTGSAVAPVAPGVAAPPAPTAPEVARATAAKADVLVLMTALKTYRNDTGRFPSTEEGLQSLVVQPGTVDNWKGPYLKGEIPKDPWGNPYVYRNPGKQNPSGVDVLSFGPDTRDGGGDDIFAP
jgi:general secretion pathway protein G